MQDGVLDNRIEESEAVIGCKNGDRAFYHVGFCLCSPFYVCNAQNPLRTKVLFSKTMPKKKYYECVNQWKK